MTTGKQKAARVGPDYLQRASRLKWWLTGILGGATVLILVDLAYTGGWRTAASPGPLNTVHATWENDCAACHSAFVPSGGDNIVGRLTHTQQASDALCKRCHAGPSHHAGHEIAAEVGGCGTCHHEHRGRNASLVDLSDNVCTTCHANLSAHVVGGKTPYEPTITRFPVNHPEFRLVADERKRPSDGPPVDKGQLSFNHQVHMTAGLKHGTGDVREWKLRDILNEKERERYRVQQPEGKRDNCDSVQLSCASCHGLDGGSFPSPGMPANGAAPPRAAGDYMLPVSYERHCQACHPLTLGAVLPNVELPHRLQPADVHRLLWGACAEQAVRNPARRERLDALPPLPGRGLTEEEEKARAEIDNRVSNAERFLYQEDAKKLSRFVFEGKTACGLCHSFEPPAERGERPQIRPVAVPDLWFEHARFDHRSHRAVECLECHADAVTSKTNTDLLLPGVAVCQKCHAPRGEDKGQKVGGARWGCTTCHAYHNGDAPRQGLAGDPRAATRRRSSNEFLSGRFGDP